VKVHRGRTRSRTRESIPAAMLVVAAALLLIGAVVRLVGHGDGWRVAWVAVTACWLLATVGWLIRARRRDREAAGFDPPRE
jgi:protein-S-isoprenylcysteine O-methyltransferase Ste14